MDIGKIYELAQDADDAAADARNKAEELRDEFGEDDTLTDGDTADLINGAIDALQDAIDNLQAIDIA